MKIKTKHGHLVDIYAIYWGDRGETYFYGFPRGNQGLSVYKLGENAEIAEPELPSNFMFFDGGLFYSPLIKENLLSDLLEYDPTAYQRFLEIIKSEGLVDEDFE